ncbi:hypothetical protein Bca4012_012941 [Brassica carinata]
MCSLGVGDVSCSTSSTKYEGVKKIEVVTVTEFLCTEKVESNETGRQGLISAADKNNGSNYLPMNPTGTSAAEEASDELDSGRIIVEEHQRPGAVCRLKEARTE